MSTLKRGPKSLSTDQLVALHDRSFPDWAESEHGFYVDRYYDEARQTWHEGVYAPIKFPPKQRRLLEWAFTLNEDGMLPCMEGWLIDIGQSWKSTLAAGLGQWMGDNPRIGINSELLFFANSKEQSSGRAFKAMLNSLAWNPNGKEIADWDTGKCVFRRTNNLAKPVVTSAGSISGSPSIYRNMDEAWDLEGDRDDTLVGEAKPTPTRNVSFLLVTSYVSFAESRGPINQTLDTFFEHGAPRPHILVGGQVDARLEGLPLYLDPTAGVWLWWNHDPYPWHLRTQQNGRTYLDNQMSRPGVSKAQALRIWRAEIVQRDDTLIAVERLDQCINPDLRPLGPLDRKQPIAGAVDIGIHGDHSGGAAWDWNLVNQHFRLRAHKHTKPIDYHGRDRRDAVQDMKAWVWKLHQEQNLLAMGYDPRDFEQAAAELSALGVNMVRFTQNTMRTEADTHFRGLILALGIELYEEAGDVREHILNAVAREIGDGGIRLVKPKNSKKIDLAVSGSMGLWIAWTYKATFEYLAKRGNQPTKPAAPPRNKWVDLYRLGKNG